MTRLLAHQTHARAPDRPGGESLAVPREEQAHAGHVGGSDRHGLGPIVGCHLVGHVGEKGPFHRLAKHVSEPPAPGKRLVIAAPSFEGSSQAQAVHTTNIDPREVLS